MATLSDGEVSRLKAELYDNVVAVGALPYIDWRSVYDVVQTYVTSNAQAPTTSATSVTTAGPTLLTLASVTGISSMTRVVLDCDDAREVVTVRAVIGSTISVVCSKTHSGTYPVEIESPLTLVRGLLADLTTLDLSERGQVGGALGLKRVDEVEWDTGKGGVIASFAAQRDSLRVRLAAACGLGEIYRSNRGRAQGGGGFEVY